MFALPFGSRLNGGALVWRNQGVQTPVLPRATEHYKRCGGSATLPGMIVTIDGPAGSGKSTAARELATRLAIAYLDTGAMYRAVTLKALREQVDMTDDAALVDVARRADIRLIPERDGLCVLLDGRDVSREIRSAEVTAGARHPAACPEVRAIMVELQRRVGAELGSFVTEGRDQGSVVFPQADVKFFLDADPKVRARRRVEEMAGAGQPADYESVLAAILDRDQRDRSRPVAPLVRPEGGICIDTTDLGIAEMAEEMLCRVEQRR